MTTEAKIREAFERKYGKGSWADKFPSPAQSGFMYGYVMGMAEAFEAAAKLCDDLAKNGIPHPGGVEMAFAGDCAAAIREMAKEMK